MRRFRIFVLLSLSSCAAASGCRGAPTKPADPIGVRAPTMAPRAALELARWLPRGAERCSVAVPARLGRGERELAALVSHNERLPWLREPEVLAYARAEHTPPGGRRAVVEYVRFARPARAQIEAELARSVGQPLAWEGRPVSAEQTCAGELTCTAVNARFVDPQTVLLAQGEWGEASELEPGCAPLLERYPEALEVSARAALLSGTELRDSYTVLELKPEGLERTVFKRYAEPGAAERALREARQGRDELGALAGVPAASLGVRSGDVLVQSTSVSFEDLRLAREDQLRMTAALKESERALPLSELDARDADAVRSGFDAQLRALGAHPAPEQLALLDALLSRARAFSPDDDGLARRQYQLQLASLEQPRAAFATAAEALRRGHGDRGAWELRKRAALARFDEPRLRGELRAAHGLAPELAARMASEVIRKLQAGEDQERAEWAFLTAHELARRARRVRRAGADQRLPLAELARVFAYLGRSGSEHADLALQVLAFSEHGQLEPGQGGLWSADTLGAGRRGLLFAATTWDDAQLIALGRALAQSTGEGPLELVLGLSALGAGERATIVLFGRREGSAFVLEQVARPLQALRWPLLERLLAAPLRALTGALYPPDELVIAAQDAREALQVAQAGERDERVRCAGDGLVVRCRGGLTDQAAARRALVAVARVLLAPEARALWSSGD